MAGPSESAPLTSDQINELITSTKSKRKASESPTRKAISEWLTEATEKYHFKYVEDTKRLYWYQNGVYRPDGAAYIGTLMEEAFPGSCGINSVNEAVALAKRKNPLILENEDKDFNILNVRNGLLDLTTRELKEHTHEHWSVAQLPVDYNPGATCPVINGFLSDIVLPEDLPLIEEIIGWMLHWWEYRPHKAVLLHGRGRNGKGALLRLIIKLLGKKNTASIGLQTLVSERFACVDLVDKAANIGGDLPSRDLSDSDKFKAATGEDFIRVEQKNVPAFDYNNWAKMIFAANKLPKSPDDTDAFYLRWIIISFPFSFGNEPGCKHEIDNTLEDRMHTPEELSGLLNLAIKGLQQLKSNDWNFSYKLTLDDVRNMYKKLSDPAFAFVLDCCEEDQNGEIPKADLYRAFKDYAKKEHLATMTPKAFGKSIAEQDYIPVSDGTINSGTVKVWRGIKRKPL
jgi:putative DNA primase/helicase